MSSTAHQTSQSPKRTGIFRSTAKKTIGTNSPIPPSLTSEGPHRGVKPSRTQASRVAVWPSLRPRRDRWGRAGWAPRAARPTRSSCCRGCRRSRPAAARGRTLERSSFQCAVPNRPGRRSSDRGARESRGSAGGGRWPGPPSRSPRPGRRAPQPLEALTGRERDAMEHPVDQVELSGRRVGLTWWASLRRRIRTG